MNRFVPFSARRGVSAPPDFVDGVPPHLEMQLTEWIEEFLIAGIRGVHASNVDAVITLLQWPIAVRDEGRRFDAVMKYAREDDDRFLDLIDLLCGAAEDYQRDALDLLLDRGMSIYRVSASAPFRLEERVTDEARAALADAVSHPDPAAEHIARAWSLVFGRDRDPGAAWNAAVKAIESLLHPIVEPKNDRATLGSMAQVLRNKPESWAFAIAARDGDTSARPFVQALELVGYEPGRHGTDPSRATLEQARVVVLQAVTIVEWLRAGALVPVTK